MTNRFGNAVEILFLHVSLEAIVVTIHLPVKLSFGVKLGLAISLLSVGVTSLSVYFFYITSYNLMLKQMSDRLKDIGRTSTFLFDDNSRASIQRLRKKTEAQTTLSSTQLSPLKPGDTLLSLSEATAVQLMQSQDFQQLVQILRKIAEASRQSLSAPQDAYPQADFREPVNAVQISTYLIVPLPESPDYQVVKFIASGFYQSIKDWSGNPIGNLYRIPDPIFATAFQTGDAQAGQDFYTDPWGTWLTAVVPIKDRSGQVVAAIGLDYNVTSEINQVRRLKWLCWSIICVSVILSILVGYALAKWLGYPIAQLHQAAQQVRAGNYATTITIQSQDELGLLAEMFNGMVAEIRSYAASLEAKNQELESRVAIRTVELEQKAFQLEHTLKELQQTQIQMIQTERLSSLGQLAAGMAHEINNPVNFIYGNLSYLTQHTQDLLELVLLYQQVCGSPCSRIQEKVDAVDLTFLQEDIPDLLGSMKTGIDRIRSIIQALRVFSRLDEAGIKKVDLHEGLDSTLIVLENRLQGITSFPAIQVDRQYGELPAVECFGGCLNQVFMHCLLNAIEALEEKLAMQPNFTPTITITTRCIEPDSVEITIADNGCGMIEAIQKRIFDPFFTTKPIGKGTGIGLSISYQIIAEQHGGKLLCRSRPQHGTEFIICLPIHQPRRQSLARTIQPSSTPL